jgi:uncharacterized integral membrane protein
MWVVKWILGALIILFVLGFAVQNNDPAQQVSLIFLKGKWETEPVPIWLVAYAAFAIGVLFWLIVSIFQVFQLSAQIRQIRKENKNIRQELDGLRNLSIDDLSLSEDDLLSPPAPKIPETETTS